MDVFLGEDDQMAQRSAWALSYTVIEHPELIHPYLERVLKKLKEKPQHPAIGRNVFRFLMEMDIPEKMQAQVYDLCLEVIPSEFYSLAERANSMTTATNIAIHYPELKRELYLILEELNKLPQPPAIKARLKSNLKLLRA